jgi:hypothetical protein
VWRTKKFGSFVDSWWSAFLAGPVTALLLGVGAITIGDHFSAFGLRNVPTSWTFVTLAGFAALGGSYEISRKVRSLKTQVNGLRGFQSRAEVAELALVKMICDDLRILVDILQLFSSGRASLFLHKKDHFILVGRYSPMPAFRRSLGRVTYPDEQGCVARAWERGEAEDPDLPEAGPLNLPPKKQWLQRQYQQQVPEEIASAFTMRSRSYAAIRLDFAQRQLGVLVIENEQVTADTKPSIEAGGHLGGSLVALKGIAGLPTVLSLSRALHTLRGLDESVLRERLTTHLPDS